MAKAKRQQQRPQARRPNPGGAPSSSAAATTDSTRLAGMRARTAATAGARGPQPQRSRFAQPPWWRRNLGTLLTVGGVVVLVAAFIIFAQVQNQQASKGIGDAVPADVLKEVTGVSPTVAATVGAGTAQKVFEATPKNTAMLTANGKPEVVYIGAEWCPYCAATRWSTVVALSRFGSFNGLTLMKSSSSDTLPNTSTFSFQKATYTSQYISFSATEDADRDQKPLATPPPAAAMALATYDVPPYTTQAGGIPFMSYGNQYVTTSGLFVPTMLQGLSWQQIAAQLNNPNSDVTKAVVGGANEQTAAICKLTNNQPGSVCNVPVIQQLAAGLPQPK
jgi:thiol-disulfide isomerase/thioredoxin